MICLYMCIVKERNGVMNLHSLVTKHVFGDPQ